MASSGDHKWTVIIFFLNYSYSKKVNGLQNEKKKQKFSSTHYSKILNINVVKDQQIDQLTVLDHKPQVIFN